MGEGEDLGCGEGVEPEGGEALLDGTEEGFKPCDGSGSG